MKKIFIEGIVLSFCFCVGMASARETNSPSVEQIIEKAVEKSKSSQAQPAQPEYVFTKVTERAEFDGDGQVKQRKSSSNQMYFCSGITSKKPIQPAEIIPVPNEVSKNNPLKSDKPKSANRGDYLNLLTSDVLAKYVFTLVKQTSVNGRPAFEVDFVPRNKKSSSGKTILDRVLNQAAGKLWIDADEFELARAQVHLNSEINFGGGLLGCVKKAGFVLERTRLPEGIWYDQKTQTDFEARKFTESMRVVTKTESSDFRKRSKG